MRTIRKIDLDDEKIVGGWNDLPPCFKRISQKAFAQSQFFTYSPVKTEFRQVRGLSEDGSLTNIWIYWFSGYSYVVVWADFWSGKIFYGKGQLCEHDFKILESRMCYCRSKCQKCGYVEEIDSSD
jgi:hypothetical protein